MFGLGLVAGAALLGSRRRRRGRRSKAAFHGPLVTLGKKPDMQNPEVKAVMEALEPGDVRLPQKSTGYILVTDTEDPETSFLGRILDFDVNRGLFGRGKTEKVLLDGHVIFETQIRNATKRKLIDRFIDEFDIQQLSASQVANILADDEDDPQMFGQTAALDEEIEDQMDELRAEMEAEYLDRFEEDYQARLKQEYPGMFSADFEEHYNQGVKSELDDSVDSHEELYHEYIVTPKHIRYKR